MEKYDLISVPKLQRLIEDAAKCKTNTERLKLVEIRGIPENPKFRKDDNIYFNYVFVNNPSTYERILPVSIFKNVCLGNQEFITEYLDVDADCESVSAAVVVLQALQRYIRYKYADSVDTVNETNTDDTNNFFRQRELIELQQLLWKLVELYQKESGQNHAIADSVIDLFVAKIAHQIKDWATDPGYLYKYLTARDVENREKAFARALENWFAEAETARSQMKTDADASLTTKLVNLVEKFLRDKINDGADA